MNTDDIQRVKNELQSLRERLTLDSVTAYICTISDYHMSEYICDYFNEVKLFSGFTGSNATLIIGREGAALYTDGRYFLQAQEELEGTGIELMKEGLPGTPALKDYISVNFPIHSVIALDSRYFTTGYCKVLRKFLTDNSFTPDFNYSLTDYLETRRTPLDFKKVYILGGEYTGQSASGKLSALREAMKEAECDTHIISSLDDIAYILNLRGSDIPCNPVFLSYLYITGNKALLFANPSSIDTATMNYLEGLSVSVVPYDNFYAFLSTVKGRSILLSSQTNNYYIYSCLESGNKLVDSQNPSVMMKAVKNSIEKKNLHKANIKDGVAMIHFLYWFDRKVQEHKPFTEMDCSDKLYEYRSMQEGFVSNSFDTIAGSGSNGAIIHYEPTAKYCSTIEYNSFLLLDSGAHYLEGTTDVTRTISTGSLTSEQIHDYTLVLKANIALARAIFLEGCSGANLDILARQYLWQEGIDYRHGTGHGIGFMLNVHEGPFSLSYNLKNRRSQVALAPGMLMSDEPGIYRDRHYGIRIENDILVMEKNKTEYGNFLGFEVMTLVPFDLRPVDFSMLTEEEFDFLKAYHERIYGELSIYMSSEEVEWFSRSFLSPLSSRKPASH